MKIKLTYGDLSLEVEPKIEDFEFTFYNIIDMFFTIIEDNNVEEDLTKEEFQSLLYEANEMAQELEEQLKEEKQLEEKKQLEEEKQLEEKNIKFIEDLNFEEIKNSKDPIYLVFSKKSFKELKDNDELKDILDLLLMDVDGIKFEDD